MNKIDFLRTVVAVSLALLVHVVALYGASAGTPSPRHQAAIQVGPVLSVREILTTSIAAKAAVADQG